MTTYATLELTDGSTFIDLLRGGVYVKDYKPGVPQLKDGGIWQDSALATGRRLIDRRFGNVIDTLDMAISGPNQDDTIARCSDLLRLLEKARDFTASDWQSDPVWLKRQAGCETNPTYALVYDYSLPELSNPFAAPFAAATELATLDGFDLGVEHSIWLSEPPGTGACVQDGTATAWDIGATWALTSAAPNGNVQALLQSVTDRIFAGANGEIIQSDDDGDTWVACTALPVGQVNCMIQTATNRIIAGETGGVWHSHNDGGAWAFSVEAFTVVYSLLELANGHILAGDNGSIWRSTDDGDTWGQVTIDPTNPVYCMIQTASGRVLACERKVWASDDNGATWRIIAFPTVSGNDMYSILQTASRRILRDDYHSSGYLAKSEDNGDTWTAATCEYTITSYVRSLLQMASGRVLAGDNGNVRYSDDDGDTWAPASIGPVDYVYSLLQTTTGRVLAGEHDQIWKSGPVSATTMGAAASCADEQFIANKHNPTNLTHIFVDDGGVWGVNLLPHVFPVNLLPLAPEAHDANSDAIYFGNDDQRPFSSLVFDLDDVVTYTVTYTGVWEYWSGAAWSGLTVTDSTSPIGVGTPFLLGGVHSVCWAVPSNWQEHDISVEGGPAITGLWVRMRVSVMGGAMTAPTQQNRNIYTVTWPYPDIAAAQVSGDIPALAEVKIANRSDGSDQVGDPILSDNRILIGLRSYDRGPGFTAYINITDEQNPPGINMRALAGATFGASHVTITGRLCTYAAAIGDTTFNTRAQVVFQPALAKDYHGIYHAFLRARVTTGASGDIHARLRVTTGTGGVTFVTPEDTLKSTSDYEVLDFGRISIPATGVLMGDDETDSTTIDIQMLNDSGAVRNVYIHDLILIPVDECAIDAVDYANATYSMVGRQHSVPHLLDFDSVMYQRGDVRTVVRTADSNGYVSSIYVPSGGPAVLQANAHQRLWVFAMYTSTTGTVYNWLASPWLCHSVRIWSNERWLGFKGNR